MEVKSYIPIDLEDCLGELGNENYWLFAGGTDLMIRKRQWHGASRKFVRPVMFINDLKELNGIESDDDYIYIKACNSLAEVYENDEAPEILKKAIVSMANPEIRNMATIGGNVANAAKVGDTLPVLFLLDARVELRSKNEKRIRKISDFIKGKYQTDLRKGELLYQIIIPKKEYDINMFYKVGSRHGDTLSKLSVSCTMNIENNFVNDFRVAFGAINNKSIRDRYIEEKIINKPVSEAEGLIYTVLNGYQDLLYGDNDKRSTKRYREETAIKILHKFLKEALNEK